MKTLLIPVTAAILMASCNSDTATTEQTTATNTTATPTTPSAPEAPATPTADAASTNQKMMDAMNGMMPDMMNQKMSGDPDHDYAMMMRSHHNAAVNMVQAYLPGATDPNLKSMAQKMLADQQAEITELTTFMDSHQPARKEPATGNELMKIMHKMPAMGNMPTNPDQHFAKMMTSHHQSAIDMSQAYLKAAKEEKMKSMAQNVITKQQAEIEQMKPFQPAS